MRILHLVHHMRDVGNGIVHVAVDLACYQQRAGHSVAVASEAGHFVRLLQENDIEWFDLPLRRTPRNLILMAPRYRRILARFHPDVVHVHVATGALIATVLRYGYHYRLIATAHRAFSRSTLIFRLADAIIALSAADAGSLERRGIKAGKLHVVHNGPLGSPRYIDVSDNNVVLHHPAITTLSGLYRHKGIDLLINAFERVAAEVPQSHLYIVGNGPDKDAFEQQARQTDVRDKISFIGFQKAPERYLRSTDVFVLASRRESFGLALIEARHAGCAIVASDAGGIPEALDGGRAGLLFPSGDSTALADAIIAVLKDPEFKAALKQRASFGLDAFAAERMARETLAVYEDGGQAQTR